MMKIPTSAEVDLFFEHIYDPVKAHEYYIKTRELKGRHPGSAQPSGGARAPDTTTAGNDPRRGKTKQQIHQDARAKQRAELTQLIKTLETKLVKLKALIAKKTHEQDAAVRKSMGKKERAAKESAKPKTAAEKAKASRETKKYQQKHQQKIKTQAKARSASKTGGGSSTTKTHDKSKSLEAQISNLEALATRVSGKIAVAKQKLAAL